MVKQWLPNSQCRLQLIFEYNSESESDSTQLHKAIDKAGPTVTIIEAQTAYNTGVRVIGGYNPYKWKNWLGKYESAPGRFIFNLDQGKRWERLEKRQGSFRTKPSTYGIAFGDGDLSINPDLKTGTATNRTFAATPNQSVLTGQAGDFLVQSLWVYQVLPEEAPESYAPAIPISFFDESTRSPAKVPDNSSLTFELLSVFIAFSILKGVIRR